MDLTVTHLNPKGLHQNPAFTQAVIVSGSARTIYIGGQNAVSEDGRVVGDDIATQTEQVCRNLDLILTAAGATVQNVVKWTIHVVQGQDVRPAIGVFGRMWGALPTPPAITVLLVAGLANPAFLIEVEAIAVTAEPAG